MKKIFCFLFACLLLLLPCIVIPQSRPSKHNKHSRHSKPKPVKHRKSRRHNTRRIIRAPGTARVSYGTASYYKNKFAGRKTANGERFSQKKLTGASNRIPLGTLVRVTNLRNNRSVILKINDRLHYRNRRLIDISKAAAVQLRMIPHGTVRVKVVIISKMKPPVKRK